MKVAGGADREFEKIKEALLTHEFVSFLKEAAKRGEIKLYKRNPELPMIVAEKTGLDVGLLQKHWDRVYRLIIDIYRGRVKPKPASIEKARAGFVNLATVLYYALYEVYGQEAVEHMYSILEPYMVSALQRGDDRAKLFFLPVTRDNIDQVLGLLREVLSRNPSLFCSPGVLSVLNLLCSRTFYMPTAKNVRNVVDTSVCSRRLNDVVSEVCEGWAKGSRS